MKILVSICFNCSTVIFFICSSLSHRSMIFSTPVGECTLSWNTILQLRRGAVRTLWIALLGACLFRYRLKPHGADTVFATASHVAPLRIT